jgi:DNA-damage-inducible protein J
MPKSAVVEVEIDEETNRKVSEALATIGLTPPELLKMVLEHLASGEELPLGMLVPNAETIEAIEELDRGEGKSFDTLEALFADLHADD